MSVTLPWAADSRAAAFLARIVTNSHPSRRCRPIRKCRERCGSSAMPAFGVHPDEQSPEVQTRQFERGGIAKFFESWFSVDSVEVHEPSPQTCTHVENKLGARPSQLCVIPCHAWDMPALWRAGWETAFVRRPANDVLGVGPRTQTIGNHSSMSPRSSSPVTGDDADLALPVPTGAIVSLPVEQSRSEPATRRLLPGGGPA